MTTTAARPCGADRTMAAIHAMPDDLPFAHDDDAERVRAATAVDAALAHAVGGTDYAGRLPTPAAVLAYMAAGKATMTVVSRRTGARFTYKFTRPAHDPAAAAVRARPIWVAVLAGADNEDSYTYLGTIWPAPAGGPAALAYRHGAKSRVAATAPSVRAVAWAVRLLNEAPQVIMEQAEFWHASTCGRCGRKLTVPASIGSGFGPECIKHV